MHPMHCIKESVWGGYTEQRSGGGGGATQRQGGVGKRDRDTKRGEDGGEREKEKVILAQRVYWTSPSHTAIHQDRLSRVLTRFYRVYLRRNEHLILQEKILLEEQDQDQSEGASRTTTSLYTLACVGKAVTGPPSAPVSAGRRDDSVGGGIGSGGGGGGHSQELELAAVISRIAPELLEALNKAAALSKGTAPKKTASISVGLIEE